MLGPSVVHAIHYLGFSPTASPSSPGPASIPCHPAPRAQTTISDRVKPQHHCFPKALPPILLKHRTSHVLHADLEKCKITQRLPQARSFCILGKKPHDNENSMRATEGEKKRQSTPQNRITDKLGNLGMGNQSVCKLKSCSAHLGYLLKAEVGATRASPTLIKHS